MNDVYKKDKNTDFAEFTSAECLSLMTRPETFGEMQSDITWSAFCSLPSSIDPFRPVDGRAAMDGDGLEPTLLPELAGHPNHLSGSLSGDD